MAGQAKLGKTSLARLAECHPDLQRLIRAYEAEAPRDFTVLCGFRGEAEQNAAFKSGASKWPRSKHNSKPSRAVDIAPYPINWQDREAFEDQRREVVALAARLGIRIRVISWDYPHFELV
jgi:peptidoglycan LD-endopeptidase CwlK